MPDLTMCATTECPRRKKCFRFTANPKEHQSYSDFFYHYGSDCQFFMKMEKESKRENKSKTK